MLVISQARTKAARCFKNSQSMQNEVQFNVQSNGISRESSTHPVEVDRHGTCTLIIIITNYLIIIITITIVVLLLQWNIRFDDSLTSTFEYVSESSYLEAYDDDYVDSSSDSQISSRSSNGGFFSDGGGSQVSHAAGPKFMTISKLHLQYSTLIPMELKSEPSAFIYNVKTLDLALFDHFYFAPRWISAEGVSTCTDAQLQLV